MKYRIFVFFFLILAFHAFAEDDMTVDRLIKLCDQAVDPSGVLKKTDTYILKRKLMMFGIESGSVVQSFKSPNKSKSITFINGQRYAEQICDGEKAWTIDSSGQAKEISGKELASVKLLNSISDPKRNLMDVFSKFGLSETTEDDQVFYKLVCHPNNLELAPVIYYISKDDYLVKRMDTKVWSNGQEIPIISKIKNYTEVAQVKIAEVTELVSMGISQMFILEDYQLNPTIDDSEFEPK